MKVLMISTDRNIFKSGSQVNLRMKKYAELFDQLDIIIFSKKGLYKKIKVSGNCIAYPTNSISKLLYIHNAKKIINNLGKYDVVTTQDPFETGIVGLYAKKHCDAKLNIQIHTDFKSKYFGHTILNKVRQDIAKIVLPQADSIRVVSERIKSSLNESLQKITIVLPIFVNGNDFNKSTAAMSKVPKFTTTLLTVSRLEREKDIHTLISAVKIVNDKGYDVGLVIVGDGSQKKSLKKFADRQFVADKVVFIGEVKKVASYYKMADIYVQASLYEGFGLSLYEAALMQLPIISTDVGLINYILSKENVLVLGYKRPKDFADKIIKLIEDKELLSKIKEGVYLDILNDSSTEGEYLEKYKK